MRHKLVLSGTPVVYSLYALLGRSALLEQSPLPHASARIVRLAAEISMIPLSETLVSDIQRQGGPPSGGITVSGAFEFLSAPVESFARELSNRTPVAYVETEYVGGEGFERAVIWSQSRIALEPLDGAGSINQVLKALGVAAPPGQEEFEFIGLGRHRSLDEWLAQS